MKTGNQALTNLEIAIYCVNNNISANNAKQRYFKDDFSRYVEFMQFYKALYNIKANVEDISDVFNINLLSSKLRNTIEYLEYLDYLIKRSMFDIVEKQKDIEVVVKFLEKVNQSIDANYDRLATTAVKWKMITDKFKSGELSREAYEKFTGFQDAYEAQLAKDLDDLIQYQHEASALKSQYENKKSDYEQRLQDYLKEKDDYEAKKLKLQEDINNANMLTALVLLDIL